MLAQLLFIGCEFDVLATGLVQIGHDAVDIGDGDPILDLIECQCLQANLFFALVQILFQLEFVSDVGADADHGNRGSRCILDERCAQVVISRTAVALKVDDLTVPATLGQRRLGNFCLACVGLLAVAVGVDMLAQKFGAILVAPFAAGLIEVGHGAIEVGDGHLILDLVEYQRLQVHLFLTLAFCADVAEHQAQGLLAGRIRCRHGLQKNPAYLVVAPAQEQFAGLRLGAVQYLLAHAVEAVLVPRFNKGREALPDERLALAAEQAGRGQVGRPDQALCAQRAIAHRRQIVEVKETCPRAVEFEQCAAQFLVLHLKLDLLHFQIVQGLLHGLR